MDSDTLLDRQGRGDQDSRTRRRRELTPWARHLQRLKDERCRNVRHNEPPGAAWTASWISDDCDETDHLTVDELVAIAKARKPAATEAEAKVPPPNRRPVLTVFPADVDADVARAG